MYTDIPNSCKEANQLIRVGILPTHTILLNMVVGIENEDNFRNIQIKIKSILLS